MATELKAALRARITPGLKLAEQTMRATADDVRSFGANFVITANEPIDPIVGTIGFEVLLADEN